MCGRYAINFSTDVLVTEFEVSEVGEDAASACQPRFNVAPTDLVPAIVERQRTRKLVGLRWGLVPSWSKDATRAARMINARVETIDAKPSFRRAFARRRSVIPALGYYEWRSDGSGPKPVKEPYFVRPADGSIMAMAGIYEFWRGHDGWLATASVITGPAEPHMTWLHDRVPLQVSRDNLDAWLDEDLTSSETARSLLTTPSVAELQIYPVSQAVNLVRNEGAELTEPLPQD